MIKKGALLLSVCMVLAGCASSNTLYNWGNYENNLFNYYDKPELRESIAANQIAFLRELENSGKVPAPGLFAEAGTFLLLQGDVKGAVEFYQKEHDAWPESQLMMSALITNLKEEEQ